MYGQTGQEATGVAPSYGANTKSAVVPRDVGAFGMAANRLRSINESLDRAITTLRNAQERITETGSPKAEGNGMKSPSPSHTLPGVLRELEATEGLVQALFEAIRFTESL